MADFEALISSTIQDAVKKAIHEALSNLAPRADQTSDGEVLSVPALADYLGIGRRQAYQLVSAQPAPFPIKRVGNRILVVRGRVREWLEAGGNAELPVMGRETRALLGRRPTDSR